MNAARIKAPAHRMDDLVRAAKAELKFTKENPVTNPFCIADACGHAERVEKLERICKELWMLRSDDMDGLDQ